MRVVHLGEVRDLLTKWDEVRAAILRGEVDGFWVALRAPTGKEAIYMGGHYADNPGSAMKITMRVSWERTKATGAAAP
jgi:hypothetical protein